jgi:hypothetical protein
VECWHSAMKPWSSSLATTLHDRFGWHPHSQKLSVATLSTLTELVSWFLRRPPPLPLLTLELTPMSLVVISSLSQRTLPPHKFCWI